MMLLYVLAMGLTISFISYVAFIAIPFLRRKPFAAGDPSQFTQHFFVPCRDEEAVIENTMTRLRATFPDSHVWVIDDDSDDDTSRLVQERSHIDPMVHLVQRRRPNARVGKGAALNSAYDEFNAWADTQPHMDRSRVIVCVMDADGELAANALEQAAGDAAFANPEVGSAQVTVRMKNRDDYTRREGWLKYRFRRFLVRMQDVEFRTIVAAMQSLRTQTETVGLGGNGQFTRLSVLDEIREHYGEPWHGSLLEDYELGVHVLLAGHKIRHLHDTFVEQEAVEDLPRLLTQRTRQAQGNIQCVGYFKKILKSPNFSTAAILESAYYLFLPYVQMIAMFTWIVVDALLVTTIIRSPYGPLEWVQQNWILTILVLVVGIAPFAIWGPIYRRLAAPERSVASGVWWGVLVYFYNLYIMITTPRAFYRAVRGKQGWAKTRRNGENLGLGAVAREA